MTATLTIASRAADLATLPAVGLDELLDIAELQTRVDRKYLLPAADLPAVLGTTGAALRVLELDGRREFGYTSTYFDDPDLASFHRAGRGRRRRFKVRTRVYRDSGEAWLEVKTRTGRGETVKDRLPYDLADAGRLTLEAREFVAAAVAARGAGEVDTAALVPVLHTSYRRTTLLVTATPVVHRVRYTTEVTDDVTRATIDSGLSWRRPGADAALGLAGTVVVETKGGSAPSPLDRALWRAGVRPSRVSKYGAGLAALTDLPDLKWHRVVGQLRPHLA
nr:polyphosphate polymerase domain-containing protein [Propionicimonas sp.]